MITRQRFRESTAGVIAFYPPEKALASAATCTLYDPGGAEIQAADTATIDSVSTTLAANASRGARSVTVASATGITAGVSYLITGGGRDYVCTVKSVSGTTVYIMGELPADFSSSDTFLGWRLTYALTSTHTESRNDNYRALWTYTISGTDYYSHDTYDVVSAIEYYPTTLADVMARHPRAAWLFDDHDLDGSEALQTTWDQMLIPILLTKGLRIERVREYSQLIPLHVALVNEFLAEHSAMIDPNLRDTFDLAKERRIEIAAAITSDVPWYDSDDDLGAEASEEHKIRSHISVTR